MNQSDKWEERASEWITTRNSLVTKGWNPNLKAINDCEERAANALSKAKSIRQARRG